MATYLGLMHLVRRAKTVDWSLLETLGRIPCEERPELLENLFQNAAKFCDDASAVAFWNWFKAAVLDKAVLQHVEGRHGEHGKSFDEGHGAGWLSDTEEVKTLQDQALKSVAEKAMEIWPQLPVNVPYNRDAYREEYALPETKRVILSEIAHRWGSTKDESEAVTLLDFLTAIKPVKDNFKILENVLRGASGMDCPTKRLVQGAIQVEGKSNRELREIGRLLLLGWVRNVHGARLAAFMKVLQPVLESSPNALNLLAVLSGQVATWDSSVTQLRKLLEKVAAEWRHSVFSSPEVVVAYDTLGALTIAINVEIDWDQRKEMDKGVAPRWLVATKQAIFSSWPHESCVSIQLNFGVKLRGSEAEPLFSETRVLSRPLA